MTQEKIKENQALHLGSTMRRVYNTDESFRGFKASPEEVYRMQGCILARAMCPLKLTCVALDVD